MEDIYFVYVNAKNKVGAYSLNSPFTGWGEYYLHGFCQTRGHYRTFKTERVLRYFDSIKEAEDYANTVTPDDFSNFNFSDDGRLGTGGTSYKRYESPGMFEPLDFSGPLEVCFTGFKKEDKERLSKIARESGMVVRKDVTVNLHFLCGGYNAGPKKLEVAQKKGTIILHESEFISLIETGVLPDDYDDQ
ncbi:BRCT domain-containing protein [Serratia plymuthica]|uniref:BRCT domain-containing protein n=1 Tax=Serratia plymuthica TaxID=82996 RepID=UPI000EFEA2DE|nr:BRCT domain-containing protein [Serratia plymuthica]NIC26552.1 hypothetical protein [Serratia plymuthica]